MNIDSSVIPLPDRARSMYREYRQTVTAGRATRDDLTLYRGLRALIRGAKVIDITLAVGGGGFDDQCRPKLAITRADWKTVHVFGDAEKFTFSSRSSDWGQRPKGEVSVRMTGFRPQPPQPWTVRGTAQCPSIPPQHRPTVGQLSDYHLLFEAVWQPRPPGDPLLLKRIDGPLFIVLAAWDLSPLEQAVLRQQL